MRLLLACLALAMGTPALAEGQQSWRDVDAETGQISDVIGLEQLASDFPDSGSVRLRSLQPLLAAGETEKVIATLQWLYDRGYMFGAAAQAQIPKLLPDLTSDELSKLLLVEAKQIGTSEVVASVIAEAGLVESVEVVLGGRALAVSSITENTIYFSAPEGNWARVSPPGAGDLSGIVEDAQRKILWVSSANLDQSEDSEDQMAGLIGVGRGANDPIFLPAPEGGNPSDLVIAPDGTLYASDPLNGSIYTAKLGDDELSILVVPGVFRSPQGLALSEDNSRLYVSDYRYGLAIIDLASKQISRVTTELPILLDGVDGLWRYGNELIAVQNGTSPMRISAFELSEDGNSITGHRILEQANPAWTEPLGGTIAGDALIYVATGQWDIYVAGELGEGKQPRETEIRQLPLKQSD